METTKKPIDISLLLIRLAIGLMFIFVYGEFKMFGGPEMWENLGGAMENFGITFYPKIWGFMAALAEFGGGVLVLLGLFFRPACLILMFNMSIAASSHFFNNEGIMGAGHAVELTVIFLALAISGPGKYSVDGRLKG